MTAASSVSGTAIGAALTSLAALLGAAAVLALAVTTGRSARHPLLAALTAAVPIATPIGACGAAAGLVAACVGWPVAGIAAGTFSLAGGLIWRSAALAPWQQQSPPVTPDDGRRIRLTVINLLYRNVCTDAVVERLRREPADVLVTLEAEEAMLLALRSRSGWRCVAVGTGDRGSMTAIWTRRSDVVAGPTLTLANGTMPSVLVPLPGSDEIVRIVGTHLAAPTRRGHLARWEAELATIRAHGESSGERLVVAGDLNASLGHPALRALAGTFADAAAQAGRPLVRTWPGRSVNAGRGLRIPFFNLDHILLGPRLTAHDLSVRRWPGTDHLSLSVDIGVN